MPGPPPGPSSRITTTSPARSSAPDGGEASSSESKTRAGPRWKAVWPASFTTQPSGARLPPGSPGRRSARAAGRSAPPPAGPASPRPGGDLPQRPAGRPCGPPRAPARASAARGRPARRRRVGRVGGDEAPPGLRSATTACARRTRSKSSIRNRRRNCARSRAGAVRRWSSRRWRRPTRGVLRLARDDGGANTSPTSARPGAGPGPRGIAWLDWWPGCGSSRPQTGPACRARWTWCWR